MYMDVCMYIYLCIHIYIHIYIYEYIYIYIYVDLHRLLPSVGLCLVVTRYQQIGFMQGPPPGIRTPQPLPTVLDAIYMYIYICVYNYM